MFNNDSQSNKQDIPSFSERYGIHPLVAFAMFALDYMLFTGLEVPSMGLLAALSAFVGFAMIVPCALVQMYSYKDSPGAAWGKAALVGLLVACPSPIPSLLYAPFGVIGAIGMAQRARVRTVRSDEDDNDSTHNN